MSKGRVIISAVVLMVARALVLALTLTSLVGCGRYQGQTPGDQRAGGGDMKDLQAELPSLHGYISVADLAKFKKGRTKSDVLKDVQWRAGYVRAGKCDGEAVMAVTYTLLADPADLRRHETYHAIFVDGKFEKFIEWLPDEMEEVPYRGTVWRRPKPTKVGDCRWLIKASNSPALSIDDLRKQAKSFTAPPESKPDVGLTIAWLLLRSKVKTRDATAEDYKRNAALRDQFNAARLDTGMTEREVERVLKAKPLESGEFDAGSCKVYGSNESFPIDFELHFANIVVVFREGTAIAIFNFPAGSSGRHDAPKGVIDYLKQQDAAARARTKNGPRE